MIQSPKKGFHNNYWVNLKSLEEFIDKSKEWTLEKRIQKLKKKKNVHSRQKTIETRKYQLIEEIMRVKDEQILGKFEEILKEYHQSMDSIKHLIKPIRSKTNVDQLIEDQRLYRPNLPTI